MVILENIDIDTDFLENIDINKDYLENIDIDIDIDKDNLGKDIHFFCRFETLFKISISVSISIRII